MAAETPDNDLRAHSSDEHSALEVNEVCIHDVISDKVNEYLGYAGYYFCKLVCTSKMLVCLPII